MIREKSNSRKSKLERDKTGRTVLSGSCMILLGYFFFEYARPQDSLVPVISYLRIPMILSLILFAIFIKNEKSILLDKLVIYVSLFVGLIALSVLYAVNTFSAWNVFFSMSIILLAVLYVMPVICNKKKMLWRFLQFWIAIHIFIAVYSITHAGRGPGGFLYDENDLALAIVMVLPISLYMSMSKSISVAHRNMYRIVSLLFVLAVGASMSRGGFLGLVTVFFVMWFLSEKRFKTLMKVILLAAFLSVPVYHLVPDKYISEMSTISNEEDDTRQARIYFWKIGWDMFTHNPVLGVGAGNYPWNVAKYQMMRPDYEPGKVTLLGGRPSHSLYFTLIPELGLAGIVLFLLILYQLAIKLRYVYRTTIDTDRDDLGLLAKALMVSAVAYLVTGAFISVLYYPPFWYLVGFVVTLNRITVEEGADVGMLDESRAKNTRRNARYGMKAGQNIAD